MDNVWPALVPGVTALLGALVGSLATPWVKWGVETRRLRWNARRKFIAAVRTAMESRPDKRLFRVHPLYAQLRPYLSEDLRQDLESDTIQVRRGGRGQGADKFHFLLLDELSELEAKWKLM